MEQVKIEVAIQGPGFPQKIVTIEVGPYDASKGEREERQRIMREVKTKCLVAAEYPVMECGPADMSWLAVPDGLRPLFPRPASEGTEELQMVGISNAETPEKIVAVWLKPRDPEKDDGVERKRFMNESFKKAKLAAGIPLSDYTSGGKMWFATVAESFKELFPNTAGKRPAADPEPAPPPPPVDPWENQILTRGDLARLLTAVRDANTSLETVEIATIMLDQLRL